MRLPDFLIAGAQRCGTTSLHYTLAISKSVFMSNPKELDFFEEDRNYSRGLGWYSEFFKDAQNTQIAGESSPEYLHYGYVAERIVKNLPSVKIIILLRNPVDRAYSGYWHAVRLAGETLPFEKAIKIEAHRIEKNSNALKHYSYLQRGLYFGQVKRYFDRFDHKNILIIISEEYFSNTKKTVSEVSRFLGISDEDFSLLSDEGINKNESIEIRARYLQRVFVRLKDKYPKIQQNIPFLINLIKRANRKKVGCPPLSSELRKTLIDYYEESNANLESLIGRDLSQWRMA